MVNLSTLVAQMASVPTISLGRRVVRCVADLHLNVPGTHANYLFASGNPNRFNDVGVRCVYFGEDAETAAAEYAFQWSSSLDAFQPQATYWADVGLSRAIDLCDGRVLRHLNMSVSDLYAVWRGVSSPTVTQMLGTAVVGAVGPDPISAIRFPSLGMQRVGKTGVSIAVFAGRVIAPDFVHVLGDAGKVLQQWP